MARVVSEGKVKVYYMATVASAAAPSVANIAAGTNLTPWITKDGVVTPNAQSMVDSATIEDTFDAQQVGSWGGGPLTLTMFRDDTTETSSYGLITYGLKGFIMISRFGLVTATTKVEVWPVEAHQPTLLPTAANEMQKFTAAFAVTSAPTLNATIAA